ncbi:MAG TPA: BRO family protein [Chthoniobacteraceae bacterium]|nr:BRO family protein [Chthoniobacteraceae bacterium]
MSALLSLQDFAGNPIRVYGSPDSPLFVAADVCRVLEIQNVTQAVDRLDEDERSMLSIGRQGEANVVTESGLYALILRCRDAMTPGTNAHRFRKWVTSEVLPAIRQTGRYQAQQALPAPQQALPAPQPSIVDSEPVKELFALMAKLRKGGVSHDAAAQVASEMVRSMANRRAQQGRAPKPPMLPKPKPKPDYAAPMIEIVREAVHITSLDLLGLWCLKTGRARSMGYRTIQQLLKAGRLKVTDEHGPGSTRIIALP